MKYAFTLLALCCALTCYAQKYEYKGIRNFPVEETTGKVTYEGVVQAEGKTAQQLYSAAKKWVARNSDARYAIETDVQGDRIVGKGSTVESRTGDKIDYDFFLTFKNGRYKYELTNFRLYSGSGAATISIESWPKKDSSGNKAQKLDSIYKGMADDLSALAAAFSTLSKSNENW